MWLRTIQGWQFFKVEYTEQGLPYTTVPIVGKSNLLNNKIWNVKK